nr:hypothetical protein [Treponema sp.]
MKILKSVQLDVSKISTTCKAYLFIIEIDDVSQNASELINILNDKTWLSKLDFLSRSNFEECAKTTIKKMLSIFNDTQTTNSIKDEFGEYMVSMNAQRTLQSELQHVPITLSEIWGKKKSGNPGFDFHTYDERNDLVTFGEAKYNSNGTSLKIAVEQINRFITESPNKDKIDTNDLRALGISQSALCKIYTDNERNLAAAFSLVGSIEKFDIDYYLKQYYIKQLLQEKNEIYFIGVKSK